MKFKDIYKQYEAIKEQMDANISEVIRETGFISGRQVRELEARLAEYVGVKHCVSCANGTDALTLALKAWGIGSGDAVFVPDFTFFASGEVVSLEGAQPVFVDVREDTYNLDTDKLRRAILRIKEEGKYTPRAIVAVDLFGQPAEYDVIRAIADEFGLYVLEDGAQGFGGEIHGKRACSFGDISTTSFFPVKPLGCYGDGGAVFTDNDEWAALMRSIAIHGKGSHKYDNVRIGLNSRLDTLQAAVLLAKLPVFEEKEMHRVNEIAERYNRELRDIVGIPVVKEGYLSSWAQYTIRLREEEIRDGLEAYLKDKGIPTMIYYPKPMHCQEAFAPYPVSADELEVTEKLCKTVLVLPLHPYMEEEEVTQVMSAVREYMGQVRK